MSDFDTDDSTPVPAEQPVAAKDLGAYTLHARFVNGKLQIVGPASDWADFAATCDQVAHETDALLTATFDGLGLMLVKQAGV